MRKHIIALVAVLLLIIVPSCNQYPDNWWNYFPGADEEKIETVDDLVLFLANNDPGIAEVNLTIDPDDLDNGQFPMTIKGIKELSGRIEIEDASRFPFFSTTGNVQSRVASVPVTLFSVDDNNASAIIKDLSVTIKEEAASLIESVISVDSGSLSATGFNVVVSGTSGKTVTGISIGKNATAETIDISNSNPGGISISEDNSEYNTILDKIIQANPDMPTRYDASDAKSFLTLLLNEQRVRFSKDVTVTADDVNAIINTGSQEGDDETKISLINGEYNIDLNGFTLNSEVVWNLGSGEGLIIKLTNGNLKMKNLSEKDYELSEAAIWIYKNTEIEFDHVNYTSEITGIKFVHSNDNMKLTIKYSDFNCDGEYAITTDATNPLSENVELNISESSITTDNASDNTAILFNVLGTVTIEDSIITGDRQALFLRGGGLISSHKLVNSLFIATGKDSTTKNYENGYWDGGNDAVLAAIVIGNRQESSTYPDGTHATLENVTVQTPSHNTNNIPYYGIYIYQESDEKPVSVSGSIRQSSSSQAKKLTNENTNKASVHINWY